MKFLNSDYNYADFAVKRVRTKSTNRTPNPNPFASTAGEGKYTGTKTYGKELGENIKRGRAGMSQLPTDQKVAVTRKKATKMGRALKQIGRFAMKNKVGLGLAAAGGLGLAGVGIARKIRSDKGQKRGNYN